MDVLPEASGRDPRPSSPRRGGGSGRRPRAPRTPRARRAGRAGGRGTGGTRGPLLLVVGVVVAMVLTLLGLQAARGDAALPGTTVAGVDVGGLGGEALRDAVAALDAAQRTRPVSVRRGAEEFTSTAGDMGYRLDVDATVEAVLHRGRQGNPLLALRDQVRATFDPARVPPVEVVDGPTFDRWTAEVADALSLPPIEGSLRIEGGLVEVVEPEPGETIDVDALRTMAVDALGQDADIVLEVPTVVSTPTTDPADLARVAAEAQRAITGPVTLTRGDAALTFTGQQIGDLLEVRVPAVSGATAPDAQDGSAERTAAQVDLADTPAEEVGADAGPAATLVLAIDPRRLLASLPAEQVQALGAPPRDATIEVSGGQARVVPGVPGFVFDAEAAAEQLLRVATSAAGPRTAQLEGETQEPAFTTADAEALGIVEEVASFTTDHPCCQSRVTNIQRIADIVRGTIVMPGETFSLNGLVGPRTADDGFVGGGAISGGEFVEQIGGGVSQFTTTLFNAIFFAGYQIVEFKPHSYYISRYPEGREATLNFSPPVDLKFTNDSPHGVYIHTSYTDTSITVSLWSTEFADVQTTTSARYGFREPVEQRVETDDLPLGEERVVQSGRQGFSVDISRTITYRDGRTAERGFTTTYLAEPRIVEVGTGRGATEEPSEEPSEEPGAGSSDGPAPPSEEPAPPAPAQPAPAPPAPEPGPDAPPPEGGDGAEAAAARSRAPGPDTNSGPSRGELGPE